MTYREVARCDLKDDAGQTLAVVLETNDVSWKLFLVLSSREAGSRSSTAEWFPTATQGVEAHTAKVMDAVSRGWKGQLPGEVTITLDKDQL